MLIAPVSANMSILALTADEESAGAQAPAFMPEQEVLPEVSEGQTPEIQEPAQETIPETETEEDTAVMMPAEKEEVIADVPAAKEEAAAPEAAEDEAAEPRRTGTDLTCSLTLDTRIDGAAADLLTFQPSKQSHSLQIGGQLNMKKIWSQYKAFKAAYTLTNGLQAFRSKFLLGSFTYTFYVNPEAVSVNTAIAEDPAAWQQAFETGTPLAAPFFNYMRCSSASYDPATGAMTIVFTINENGTGKVSVATMEDFKANGNAGSMPEVIEAYSPEGAFTIRRENFKKGVVAVPGQAGFGGEIDMDPWMALVFPIRFQAQTTSGTLSLDVPAAAVTFNVENGTWADGTTEPKTIMVDTDVVELENGFHAAGTLDESLIPSGMLAAEGFDQENGKWVTEINTSENGILLTEENAPSISHTFVFEKKAEIPSEPENPGTPDNKPEDKPQDQPSGTDKPSSQKPSGQKPSTGKPANKPNSVQTDAFTGFGTLLGLQGLSAAGLWKLSRRRKK